MQKRQSTWNSSPPPATLTILSLKSAPKVYYSSLSSTNTSQQLNYSLGFLYRFKGCLCLKDVFVLPTVKLLCSQPSCLSLTEKMFCIVMLPYKHFNTSLYSLCNIRYTFSQMTHFIFIIVLCMTQLDGLPYSQEEIAISCYSFKKLYCCSFKTTSHLMLGTNQRIFLSYLIL